MSAPTKKVAIAFGLKKSAPSSGSSTPKSGTGFSLGSKPAAFKNGAKRPHHALRDDSDDDDDGHGVSHEIAGFDQTGGAIHVNGDSISGKDKKRVIPVQPNAERYAEARKRQKGDVPLQEKDVVIDLPKKKVQFGLTVMPKRDETTTEENDTAKAP